MSFFGLTFDKLLVIGLLAVLVVGPDRLPLYAEKLGRLVRGMRDMANGAKDRMREEMGPEFDEVDWKKLDPRQYDPRRIVREALLEEPARQAPSPQHAPAASASPAPSTHSSHTHNFAAAAAAASVQRVGGQDASVVSVASPADGVFEPAPFDDDAT